MRKEESAQMGQKIRTETSPDRSSHSVNDTESMMGRKMAGGATDLSRSISGAKSQVEKHPGAVRRGKSTL